METMQSSASGRAEIGDKNSTHMVKHDMNDSYADLNICMEYYRDLNRF